MLSDEIKDEIRKTCPTVDDALALGKFAMEHLASVHQAQGTALPSPTQSPSVKKASNAPSAKAPSKTKKKQGESKGKKLEEWIGFDTGPEQSDIVTSASPRETAEAVHGSEPMEGVLTFTKPFSTTSVFADFDRRAATAPGTAESPSAKKPKSAEAATPTKTTPTKTSPSAQKQAKSSAKKGHAKKRASRNRKVVEPDDDEEAEGSNDGSSE